MRGPCTQNFCFGKLWKWCRSFISNKIICKSFLLTIL
jgi:hypothetical protein